MIVIRIIPSSFFYVYESILPRAVPAILTSPAFKPRTAPSRASHAWGKIRLKHQDDCETLAKVEPVYVKVSRWYKVHRAPSEVTASARQLTKPGSCSVETMDQQFQITSKLQSPRTIPTPCWSLCCLDVSQWYWIHLEWCPHRCLVLLIVGSCVLVGPVKNKSQITVLHWRGNRWVHLSPSLLLCHSNRLRKPLKGNVKHEFWGRSIKLAPHSKLEMSFFLAAKLLASVLTASPF